MESINPAERENKINLEINTAILSLQNFKFQNFPRLSMTICFKILASAIIQDFPKLPKLAAQFLKPLE